MVAIPIGMFRRDGYVVPDAVSDANAEGLSLGNDGSTGLVATYADAEAVEAASFTIRLARTVDGQPVEPRVITLSPGDSRAFGPFDPADYGAEVVIEGASPALSFVGWRWR